MQGSATLGSTTPRDDVMLKQVSAGAAKPPEPSAIVSGSQFPPCYEKGFLFSTPCCNQLAFVTKANETGQAGFQQG